MQLLKEKFDKIFGYWNILLPDNAIKTLQPGAISQSGWSISYAFYEGNLLLPHHEIKKQFYLNEAKTSDLYLEIYARHPVSVEYFFRIYASGETRYVNSPTEIRYHGPNIINFDYELTDEMLVERFPIIADPCSPNHEVPEAFKLILYEWGDTDGWCWVYGQPKSIYVWAETGAFDFAAYEVPEELRKNDNADITFAFGDDADGSYLQFALRIRDYVYHARLYESERKVKLPQPLDFDGNKDMQRQMLRNIMLQLPARPLCNEPFDTIEEAHAYMWGLDEDIFREGVIYEDEMISGGYSTVEEIEEERKTMKLDREKMSDSSEGKKSYELMGNDYVAHILEKWAPSMVLGESVVVPHDEEEMNWRLFFAHGQDMMGFRADIFTGGWNEGNNPFNAGYQGLRDRWPDSKSLIRGLAEFWNQADVQAQIKSLTTGKQSGERGIKPVMALLRGERGNAATRIFADALDDLSGPKIAYKTRRMIRAYLQNSALLAEHGASFQQYLESIVPDLVLPSQEIVRAERAWRKAIERDFYNVGPALANYLIADWLLWLWRQGQIEWFESYKSDSVFLTTLAAKGKLPSEAGADFSSYCRALSLPPEWLPKKDWILSHYPLPPRILNEAIWLEEAATNQVSPEAPVAETESHVVSVNIDHVAWPIRFFRLLEEDVEPDETETETYRTPSVTMFRDDDKGYLDWRKNNLEGYVVNAHRKPVADYLILHRSPCWCISRPFKNDEKWTAGFVKVCSNSLADLKTWAQEEVGGELHPCGICLPRKGAKL